MGTAPTRRAWEGLDADVLWERARRAALSVRSWRGPASRRAATEMTDDDLDRLVGDAELVRRVYDSLPISLCCMAGPEHRYVASNAAHKAILGRADVLGRSALEANPEFGGQHFIHRMDEAFRTGEAQRIPEWRIQVAEPDGSYRDTYIDAYLIPRTGPDGRTEGLNCYTLDVTDRVRTQLAAQRRAAEAERRYQRSRDVVLALQRALLPPGVPVLQGTEIAASYLVADTDAAAGGDWFDALRVPDGRLAVVVGDIVGHGVDAAAAMGQLRAVVRDRLEGGDSLADVIAAADRTARRVPGARAATLCIATVDPTSGAVAYCTAGHPPPLVVTGAGRTTFLPSTGTGALGSGVEVAVEHTALLPDDVLLLYTDGIVERPGMNLTAGFSELATVVADVVTGRAMQAPHLLPAEHACQQTIELLVRATGHTDDITLVAVRRTEPVPDLSYRGRAVPSSVRDVRRELRTWLASLGVPRMAATAIQHAVGELVSNCVVHAYERSAGAGDFTVRGCLDETGTLHLTVADFGSWRESETDRSRVHGLTMVADLVDELRIERTASGTRSEVSVRLLRPALVLAAEHLVTVPPTPPEDDVLVIAEHNEDTLIRLALHGPIDLTTAEAVRLEVDRLLLHGRLPVVLDLSEVTLLASAGVAVLHEVVAARRTGPRERGAGAGPDRPAGSDVVILAPQGSPAQTVLHVVGLPYRTDAGAYARLAE